MADPVKAKVAEIHAALEQVRVTAAQLAAQPTPKPIPWAFGNVEGDQNKSAPFVTWFEPGGEAAIGDRSLGGSTKDTIGTLGADLTVRIWHRSLELARAEYFNLIIAARKVATGPGAVWGKYEVPTNIDGSFAENGAAVIEASVRLAISIPAQGVPTADVQTQTHEVSANGEVVC